MAEADPLLAKIAAFAAGFELSAASPGDIEAALLRIVDTFGAALGGFDEAASSRTRAIALASGGPPEATVFGTAAKACAEMAAFANATASREAEMNDVYMSRAGAGAHPSDVILPILALAEAREASGAAFLASVLVAYEIYVQMSDEIGIDGFDQTTLAGIAVAAGAARVAGLGQARIAQAVSMAAVANNPLNQARRDTASMWKSIASGQAGKAGVFAALLAEAGIEGPAQPFSGSCGWLRGLAGGADVLIDLGGASLRIGDVQIKPRASCQVTISSILAAEDAAAKTDGASAIEHVLVETYAFAQRSVGSGAHRWNPTTRESADHSIPYVVAATLCDGTVGPAQFRPERIADPRIRALMARVEVVADDSFTARHEAAVPEHHTRVTVTLSDGRRVVGLTGGASGDLADAPSAAMVEDKFLRVAKAPLGSARAREALAGVRGLTSLSRAGDLMPLFHIHDPVTPEGRAAQ